MCVRAMKSIHAREELRSSSIRVAWVAVPNGPGVDREYTARARRWASVQRGVFEWTDRRVAVGCPQLSPVIRPFEH
ncbi:protein of unknown function [Pararobbsia alpina]